MTRALLAAALVALAAAPHAQVSVTEASCATNGQYYESEVDPTVPNGHIAWPADDPVWEFDVYQPSNRTTLNSSGLEIRDVRFQGRLILARAGVPVLNVEYDEGQGSCGCFRDWQTDPVSIDIGSNATVITDCGTRTVTRDDQPVTIQSGIALSAPGVVETACEANEDPANTDPGGDVGTYDG